MESSRPEAVFLGLGSNLGDRAASLRDALERLGARLRQIPGDGVLRVSTFYETEPVGPVSQPWYLNAVAECRVSLSPHELLGLVKAIELDMGRNPGLRWGPRVIDIDLLLFGEAHIVTDELVIPHPDLWNRAFVLVPLLELLPGGALRERVRERLNELAEGPIVRPF